MTNMCWPNCDVLTNLAMWYVPVETTGRSASHGKISSVLTVASATVPLPFEKTRFTHRGRRAENCSRRRLYGILESPDWHSLMRKHLHVQGKNGFRKRSRAVDIGDFVARNTMYS